MTRRNNLAHLHRDRGYRWSESDPELGEVRRHVTESGRSLKEISDMTARVTGGVHRVAPSTLAHWMDGTTRNPQNSKLTWVAFVLGYNRVRWVKR